MPKKNAKKNSSRRDNYSYIGVYVPKEIHSILKKQAAADGRSLSNYLNRFLLKVCDTLS